MKCRPGDIVLIPFPFSDVDARKKRPALVLTQPDARGDFASLAITSRETHEKAVALTQDQVCAARLPKPSWIRFDKVYTLNTSLVVGSFGFLHPDFFERVHSLFCDHFLCGSMPSS